MVSYTLLPNVRLFVLCHQILSRKLKTNNESLSVKNQFAKRMILPHKTDRFNVPDCRNSLDGAVGFIESKSVSFDDLFVASGMQVGKTAAELDLFPIDGDTSVCALSLCFDLIGNIVVFDAEEPSDTGMF